MPQTTRLKPPFVRFIPGDIIAMSGRGPISRLIQLATLSRFSHVGLVVDIHVGNRVRRCIAESTTLCELPDELTKQPKDGVQIHDLYTRLATYQGTAYHVAIMAPIDTLKRQRLEQFVLERHMCPYDYEGAIMARPFRLLRLLPQSLARDQEFFCSEFVASALIYARVWPDSIEPHKLTPKALIRLAVRQFKTHLPPVKIRVT